MLNILNFVARALALITAVLGTMFLYDCMFSQPPFNPIIALIAGVLLSTGKLGAIADA